MSHVLVVEDDVHNAALFRKLLEKRCGASVTVTESPEEVFRLARAGVIGLVLMDVSLTNSRWQGKPVSGVELCRHLKSDPETVGIPVVLATAHAMRGDPERLLVESGADGYVAKPIIDHAAFALQIREHLGEAA